MLQRQPEGRQDVDSARDPFCSRPMAVAHHTGNALQKSHEAFDAKKQPQHTQPETHTYSIITWPTKSLPLTDGSSGGLLSPLLVVLRFKREAQVMSGVRVSPETSRDSAKDFACEHNNVNSKTFKIPL